MMKKVKFIYNPASGEAQVGAQLDRIISLYQRSGLQLVPYRLEFQDDDSGMFEDMDHTYDHAVIAGGDGTVNYAVNRMMQAGHRIPVGILPTGTANDFASALGMNSSDLLRECGRLIRGYTEEIDLGRVNGTYFVNVFSCGLFTEISQKTPTILKNTFGKLAYYVEGIGELPRFRRMHVSIKSDGGSYEGPCIIFFVFNGKTAGNIRLAYLSELNDGLLDILVIKGDNPFITIQTAFRYLSRFGKGKTYPPGVEHIRCTSLTAHALTNEPTDIDGQPGPPFPLQVTCEKNALKVIVPSPK